MKTIKLFFTIIFLSLSFSFNTFAQNEEQDSLMKEFYELIKLKDVKERYNDVIIVFEKMNSIYRFYSIGYVANLAFEIKNYENAKDYAEELLKSSQEYPSDWNYGNAIHDGNIVLGRLALLDNEIPKAKEYLILAGKTPGSPQLNSFGPDLSLANDLLQIDETEIVLEYLSLCSLFWKNGADKISYYENEIKAGNKPELNKFIFMNKK